MIALLERAKKNMIAGDLAAAEAAVRTVIGNHPDDINAQFVSGTLEYHKKNYKKAIQILERVVQSQPDFIDALLNLGSAYCETNQLDKAVANYKKIIEKIPGHFIVHNNLGGVYKRLNRFAEAQREFEKSIEMNPDYWVSHHNLGNLCIARRKFAEAELHFKKALSLDKNPNVYACLIGALKYSNPDEAYQLALDVANSSPPNFALLSAFPILMEVCEWDVINSIKDDVISIALNRNAEVGLIQGILMPINKLADVSRQQVFDVHKTWGKLAMKYCRPFTHHSITDRPSSRLRIGYVSADFREHSVGHFINNIITNHDPEHFQIFCYSNCRGSGDYLTKKIRQSCHSFATIYNLTDEELAKKIHNDGIHILVDLAGHTSESRISVLRYRPAPIQVTYLGYPNTTGLETVDYRITDKHSETEGNLYTEELLYMPESFICFGGFPDRETDQDLPSDRKGHITFGSFNNVSKITPETIRVWSEIMNQVSGSRLLIKSGKADKVNVPNIIKSEFDKYGINMDRIELRGFNASREEHLDCYNEVDIALDTFPYNGTTTTCEALWMGVPVITLVGDCHAQRVSYSILKNIGIDDGITFNSIDYIKNAVALAGNDSARKMLRTRIRENIRKSILCDPVRFTKQLENIYKNIWVDRMGDLPWDIEQAGDHRIIPSEDGATIKIKGEIDVCVPNDLSLLTPYVLLEQENWFEAECEFVRHLLKPGMNVIDIGANYGIYTLISAAGVGTEGKVWAFEPATTTAAFLSKSLKRNKLDNVRLVCAGLSNQNGKARLVLNQNAELNSVINDEQCTGDHEQITLLALDDCLDDYGWDKIDFLKLDAEGFESNIIEGGKRFFKMNSPLVMFEIKHGREWNLELVNKFLSLGYESYKLIPDLNLLVPFDKDNEIDPFQLNLFCCKPDRAEMLISGGYLVRNPLPVHNVPAPTAGLWVEYLQQFPYAARQFKHWLAFIKEHGKSDGWIFHQQALDYYTLSRRSDIPASDRYAYLQCAYQLLFLLLKSNANLANTFSFIRVAAGMGECRNALAALDHIISQYKTEKPACPDEPFLSVSPNYDIIDPGENVEKWLYASLLERHEIMRSYSSYFTRESSLQSLEMIKNLDFQTAEMERRRQLIRIVSNLQQAPEFNPLLTVKSDQNLNTSYWPVS